MDAVLMHFDHDELAAAVSWFDTDDVTIGHGGVQLRVKIRYYGGACLRTRSDVLQTLAVSSKDDAGHGARRRDKGHDRFWDLVFQAVERLLRTRW
jgi:hypothetical protein